MTRRSLCLIAVAASLLMTGGLPTAAAETCTEKTFSWDEGQYSRRDNDVYGFGIEPEGDFWQIIANGSYFIVGATSLTSAGVTRSYTAANTEAGQGKYLVDRVDPKFGEHRYTRITGTLNTCQTATPLPRSVKPTPEVIVAGQTVAVAYRGEPNTTLDILARTQPATTYSKVGTVLLDGSGVGRSTHRPNRNTRITARRADGQLSDTAPLIGVQAVASLNIRRTATRSYTFTGTVSPPLGNRLVSLYDSGRTRLAQARTNSSGVYSMSKTFPVDNFTTADSYFFVRTPSDSYNYGATSRVMGTRIY